MDAWTLVAREPHDFPMHPLVGYPRPTDVLTQNNRPCKTLKVRS
ncbi:hypothetical protein RESH_02236 [Rhodopirellula europaea SH398]|uniref:Uncharacterized protein n=1 Tax=Rhodopirellula europaea SH398 TaxID=1263868 RepID=M5SLX2_9BACT|nr:hypothetical protein RESH_02236 [Rhodopirellula europaea SH398]